MAHTGDEILGLEWFADQFIGFHRECFIGDGFVDHARHQDDGCLAEAGMLFDVLTDLIAILVGHDHVGDDHVGALLLDLHESGGGIVAGDHVDVLAAERDLDDFAHGGPVIDEIYGRSGGHSYWPPSDESCSSPSSTSRSASSMSSVAERI